MNISINRRIKDSVDATAEHILECLSDERMEAVHESLRYEICNQTERIELVIDDEICKRNQQQKRMYGIKSFGLTSVVHADDFDELVHDLQLREDNLFTMLANQQYLLVYSCLNAYEERGELMSVGHTGLVQHLTLDKTLARSRARRDIPTARAIELYKGDSGAGNEAVSVDAADWQDDPEPSLLNRFKQALTTAFKTLRYLRTFS